jgi:hypothetical protein
MDNELNETSFMDTLPSSLVNKTYREISDHLLDEWINSNSDEGVFWSDYQIASQTNNPEVIEAFNKHYQLTAGDEEYLNA